MGEERTCLNCGAPLTDAYCAACGQSAATKRLDVREIARQVVAQFTSFEGPWSSTVRGLTTAPGRTVQRYLDGHRVA